MKKILIIGDYSSLGLNLKKGFIKLGMDVTLFTNGDSWKNIKKEFKNDILVKYPKNISMYSFEIRGSGRIIYLLKYLFYIRRILKKKRFDYIIIMNQEFISNSIKKSPSATNYVSLNFLKTIIKENGKICILACGDDSYYLKSIDNYKYFPYLKEEIEKFAYSKKESEDEYNKVLSRIDGIIPCCWDYAQAYRLHYKDKNKIKKTIQFPIDLSGVEYKPNIVKEKIVIFHGLNRENFKGTNFIKKAMANIYSKYPDKVEIIIDGKLPIEEYKKILERTNIVIDQCKSYSYGMNALISMGLGKVVFSGNEEECMKEYGRKNIPIINIKPDVSDIERKLEYYILNQNLIYETGLKSRKFVEEFHESSIVAEQYLKLLDEKDK